MLWLEIHLNRFLHITSWKMLQLLQANIGSNSLLVGVPDSWLKGWSSNPGRSSRRIFSPELNVCALTWCPFHPCVTAVVCKRPRSFCQKCRWKVTPKHAYTLDPTKLEWVDYVAVQAQCGSLSGNELTCSLSGNIWPQSSQLAEPLWTDPGIKSEEKRTQAGNKWSFSPNASKEKSHTHLQQGLVQLKMYSTLHHYFIWPFSVSLEIHEYF